MGGFICMGMLCIGGCCALGGVAHGGDVDAHGRVLMRIGSLMRNGRTEYRDYCTPAMLVHFTSTYVIIYLHFHLHPLLSTFRLQALGASTCHPHLL